MEQDFSLNTDNGIVECKICGKQLSSNASLIDHHRTHTGERPYNCGVCNKSFTQKAHLNIHKRTHTGEKPYGCSICQKRFSQSSHLKNHKRIHTGEKAYLCSICNMGFSRKPRLEQHLQEHMLHDALVTKSKKTALEKEAYKILSTTKSTAKQETETEVVSRKRKPSFVTRVHQNDTKLSHLADSNDSDLETGLGNIVIKTEPPENQNLFSCEGGSNFHGQGGSSSGESDANGEDDYKQHDSSDWECKDMFPTSKVCEGSGNTGMSTIQVTNLALCSPEQPSNICCVTSSEQPGYHSVEEGDVASMTSENNSSFLGESHEYSSRGSSSQTLLNSCKNLISSSRMIRPKSIRNSSGSSMTSLSGIGRGPSQYNYRMNKSVTLIDFSAEDLISHLMARDKVLKCVYCCIIFQDPAMYHLHRSMHDKSDIRCCNTCGKMSRDKYDFVAHYLCEHK